MDHTVNSRRVPVHKRAAIERRRESVSAPTPSKSTREPGQLVKDARENNRAALALYARAVAFFVRCTVAARNGGSK